MTDDPNYVTPNEAYEKFCPLNKSHYCDGPRCMAWRWGLASGKIWFWVATNRDPEPRKNWIPIEEFEVNKRKAGKFKEAPTHGYCGMVRS